MKKLARRIGRAAGLTTLAAGFIPLALLSLITDSFWPRSKVAVPLSLVPSVLIGDSILLPLFNWHVVLVLSKVFAKSIDARLKKLLAILAFGALVCSFALNLWLHVLWTRDEYSGYIDLKRGTLSFAGKWHLVFASLQMALVLWFVAVVFVFQKDRQRVDRVSILKAWRTFVIYSSLSIGDFAIMHGFIARSGILITITDCFALAPLPLSLAVYAMFSRLICQSTGRDRIE